jgi:hypothetical protein
VNHGTHSGEIARREFEYLVGIRLVLQCSLHAEISLNAMPVAPNNDLPENPARRERRSGIGVLIRLLNKPKHYVRV